MVVRKARFQTKNTLDPLNTNLISSIDPLALVTYIDFEQMKTEDVFYLKNTPSTVSLPFLRLVRGGR